MSGSGPDRTIYLDYNATAPLRPAARAAWLAAQDGSWGNPSSVHAIGQRARAAVDAAKARIAAALGCRGWEVVLTSGGSEANALAIHAAVALAARRQAQPAQIVAAAIDHSSVLRNAAQRAELVAVGVDGCGRIDPAAMAAACSPRTALVAFQAASNEIGTIQDQAAIIAAVRAAAPQALILVDACQGLFERSGAPDFLAGAGHKLGAPAGTGFLVVRGGLQIPPLIAGGRQQQDRRSGTEDVAGAAALAVAIGEAAAEHAAEDARLRALLDGAFAAIRGELPAAVRIGDAARRVGHVLSLAHPGLDHQAMVQRLDLAGVAVSHGAACMAARGEPSHVLRALGLPAELARGALRISAGYATTAADIAGFAAAYVREARAALAR